MKIGLKYLAGIEDIQAAKHRNADSNCCEGSVDRCSTVDMTACITTETAWEIDSFNVDLLGFVRTVFKLVRFPLTSGLVITL